MRTDSNLGRRQSASFSTLSHLHLYASLILFLRGRIFGAALFSVAVVV
jgi:hypothetical protein